MFKLVEVIVDGVFLFFLLNVLMDWVLVGMYLLIDLWLDLMFWLVWVRLVCCFVNWVLDMVDDLYGVGVVLFVGLNLLVWCFVE